MRNTAKSASSGQSIPLLRKLDEAARQFRMLWQERAPWIKQNFDDLAVDFEFYSRATAEYGGFDLKEGRVFEIGCGQRPHRLFHLIANGIDAYGIELEPILLTLTLGRIGRSLREVGIERTVKTVGRRVLFDAAENYQLKRYLSEVAGCRFDWPTARLLQGSAADPKLWPNLMFDFILSEVVFEHIPEHDMAKVCNLMADHMTDRAIAFVKPAIFTGIRGGHSSEWYNPAEVIERACPPWDHLRENRFPANTYMNKFRIADYRRVFSQRFTILHEEEYKPDMGRQYLTPEIRADLSNYTDEEIFSNDRIFILKKRTST